jgi:hypothetical protein
MHSYIRGAAYGWVDVNTGGLPQQFLNKRISIEILNEQGEAVASNYVSEADKDSILTALYAKHGVILLINECYPHLFSEEELQTVVNTLETLYKIVPSDNEIKQVRHLLDTHGESRLVFALDMSESSRHRMGQALLVSSKSPYYSKHFSFDEAIEFLSGRDGVYYATNSEGVRCYDFIDMPNKKQISNQVKKDGYHVVFLNFKDGKEYEIA